MPRHGCSFKFRETGTFIQVKWNVFSFAFPSIDPDLKLTVILSTCIAIQMMAWSFSGMYISSAIDILNSVLFLNLGVFSQLPQITFQTTMAIKQ